jgi:Predicted nucleotide-binding protein containing TIR-like domain
VAGLAHRLCTQACTCYYEDAIAYTLRLPILVLVQENVVHRVVFDHSYDGYVGEFPEAADRTWLASDAFRVPFGLWKQQLEQRRDIFLGYCSSSEPTAKALKRFLQEDINASVLDWKTDFAPGSSILEQIAEAASRCSAGIFLFTADDQLTDRGHKDKAVPRDNVVFEAGYFTNAKGKDHVLIIRETGAKMPADLGGDIYAALQDKSKIAPIKETIRRFIDDL